MRNLRLLVASALLTCHALAVLQAQSAITATGTDISGGGGSVSYSVGQIGYTLISSPNHSVNQGVQQPWEVSVMTGIDNTGDMSLDLVVYPNPASDILRLKTGSYESSHLRYRLYDLNGRLLLSGRVEGGETSIAIGHLTPAAYLLRITDKNISIKSFSIIKR
jgi:spore coat protein U-like protein